MVVLPDLESKGLIEKVHWCRPLNEVELKAIEAKRRKIMKRNAGALANGITPPNTKLQNSILEWFWRRKEGSDEKWAAEEKLVTMKVQRGICVDDSERDELENAANMPVVDQSAYILLCSTSTLETLNNYHILLYEEAKKAKVI